MKIIDTTYRTKEDEVMDDFDLQGAELEQTLEDLDKVNKWLGGNEITIDGIKKLLSRNPEMKSVKILDVGCGNGSLLREIADFGRSGKIRLELKGIDANPFAIGIAKKLSISYPEISFEAINIFSSDFKREKADIILCTLTLHHFKDAEIKDLLRIFVSISRFGVVINDLQRSRLAYYLFQIFCAVFIRNEIARKDGLISIRRGFKRTDLENYSEGLKATKKIRWKWAFRYQWLLFKTNSTKEN